MDRRDDARTAELDNLRLALAAFALQLAAFEMRLQLTAFDMREWTTAQGRRQAWTPCSAPGYQLQTSEGKTDWWSIRSLGKKRGT